MSALVSDTQISWWLLIHLRAETHLSEYKAGITARCTTQVHAREVKSRVEAFQVAPSVPYSSSAFEFPFFAKIAHSLRSRSGIALFIHIRLPGSPPSPLTSPPPSLNTAMADQQASVGTHKTWSEQDDGRRTVSVSFPTACFWHNLHPQQQITAMMSAKSDELAHINDNKYGLFTHLETENRKQMKSSNDSVFRSGCGTVGPRADQIWLLSFFPSLFADKSTCKAEAPESFQRCQEKPQNDLCTKLLKEHIVR